MPWWTRSTAVPWPSPAWRSTTSTTGGEFTFSVEEDIVLEWRHAPLTLAELEPGDTISVTYTGAVLESYPAQLQDVVRVQLLDDEK